MTNWPTNPSSKTSQGSVHYGARKLGEVATVFNGKTFGRDQYRNQGKLKTIKVKDFDETRLYFDKDENGWVDKDVPENLLLTKGDTLIINAAHSATHVGSKIGYCDSEPSFNLVPSGEVMVIRPKTIEPLLLNALIRSTPIRRKIKDLVRGIHLYPKDMVSLKIPVPPLKLQKQIVERMDKIAEAQKLNNELIQKSDELFQSLLHKELNPAGKNWEVKKLGDVCEIVRGGSPRPINKYLTNSPDGINWIKIGDVKEGEMYITSTKQKISSEGMSKTRLVKEGDFILSNSMSFGRPYIMKISGAIHDGWLLLRLKNADISTDFLYYILGSSQTQIQFEKSASGGVVRNLNSDLVRKIKIPLPPIKTQKQIVEKLSAVQDYKKKLLRQKELLQELFDSTLDKAMKGEEVK